ncbi:MAG: IclR family transcriptional regulator [Actinomycetota bacterium]|nr:IclR family transcriptional regulator [Actinomycetota bacterium]
MGDPTRRATNSVQSIERAFSLLELLATGGGARSLSELSAASGLAPATIHRLMGTLIERGYVRRASDRRYLLGPRLIALGDQASRAFGTWATQHLRELVELTGETANLAVLEGDLVLYVAQAPGKHAMRMFTEPGRRVEPHCTAVGKAMLARLDDPTVRAILERTGMARHTATTLTKPNALLAQLAKIREQGYALDDGEQEVGVRCVAVALDQGPSLTAISVSGPLARLTDQALKMIVPALSQVAKSLSAELDSTDRAR